VGCNNDNNEIAHVDSNEIRVVASLGNSTRATLTEFEAGDVMSLYAVEYSGDEVADIQSAGNYLNNEALTFNGSEWLSERTLYWSENPCDFYAFYPYRANGPMSNVLFEVATNQNSAESEEALSGYEASDLMWAKAERVAREDGAVQLSFKHMMSRLVVNIERGPSYEGELPEEIDVHIYNTATTARVNWKIGSLEKYQNSPSKTIKMRRVDADTFDAIVVPQFIERSTPLVEVTMEGIAYLLEYEMSFRPGMQHTITVTLNTSPDQEKIEINIDGDITEW
jgi:hypothetical protein